MTHYLSKERLEELKVELNRLKKDDTFEIAERLKRAKEFGDLSENFEYSEAKEAQARLENKIIELEEVIRNAEIIKKIPGKKNAVHIGSTLTVSKNGDTLKYTIVGSMEAKPESNLISNESPLGKAFLGKKTGEIVETVLPNGKAVKYKILDIE